MKRVFAKILVSVSALSAICGAATFDYFNFSGVAAKGDTLKLSSASVLRIDEPIALDLPGVLFLISAKEGIHFGAEGSLSLSGAGARLVVDADSDADGNGSISCDASHPCFSVSGEGASAKIYTAGEGVQSIAAAREGGSARVYSNLYSAADLAAAAERVNSSQRPASGWSFALAKEIDLSGTEFEPFRGPLLPDGKSRSGFSGSFDGRGHRIDGLVLNIPSEENVGLFGLTANALIERVGVVDANISGWAGVGALVGYLGAGSEVRECFSTGSVVGNYQVGGLIGEAYRASISDSYSEATIAGTRFVGGVVGFLGLKASAERILNAGTVNGDEISGGVAGRNRFGRLSDSRSAGKGVGSCLQGECDVAELSEGALTDKANFSSWDFSEVWKMGSFHPELAAFRSLSKPAKSRALQQKGTAAETDLWESVPEGMHRVIFRDAAGRPVGQKVVSPGQKIPRALLEGGSAKFAK